MQIFRSDAPLLVRGRLMEFRTVCQAEQRHRCQRHDVRPMMGNRSMTETV